MKNNLREINIIKGINLAKLPFKILDKDLFNFTKDLSIKIKEIFSLLNKKESLKWCFSSQKKIKVFLIIFNANENVKSIYKEEVAKRLPEYSYKTVASIIDEGLDKGYYEKLAPRSDRTTDLKISNIRPSEELVIEFINWNIEVINTISKFLKKYQ